MIRTVKPPRSRASTLTRSARGAIRLELGVLVASTFRKHLEVVVEVQTYSLSYLARPQGAAYGHREAKISNLWSIFHFWRDARERGKLSI